MRRAVFRRTTTGLALFPFLAVLICTMGSLIVLLVLVLQQARVQGGAAVAEAVEQAVEQARQQRAVARQQQAKEREEQRKRRELHEELEWQREQLEEQLASQNEQLKKQRLELSHLEDHIRRLEDQHRQLMSQHDALTKNSSDQTSNSNSEAEKAQRQTELNELLEKIAAAKKALEEARERNAKRPPSFAIVPYDGKNGTRRRPIYLECGEEGIVLHPEGVVFMPRDFQGPLGPGNPLDAALRTVREYWARVNDPQQMGEPYPLLIVRPSGAIAYAMARAAMKSWEEEFGYELVDAETVLEFPPADPELEQLISRTIRDARQRQAALAAAMPSRFQGGGGGGSAPSFASSPPSPADENASGFARKPQPSNGLGKGNLVPGTSSGVGNMLPGTSSGERNSMLAGGASGAELAAGGRGSGGGGGGSGGPASSSNIAGNSVGNATGNATSGATGGATSGTATGAMGGGNGGSASRAANGAAGNAARTANGGTAGGAGVGGGAPGFAATMPGVSPTPDNSNSDASRAPSGGAIYGGAASQFSPSGGDTTAVAAQRGANWALPKQASYSTGITRPIRVRCFADRLVIMPERGDDFRPRTVMWDAHKPQASTEEFVAAIWKHTERWGLAVRGGYWKPVLSVEVLPGAAARYQELTTLLSESGLEFQEKQPSNARGPSRNTTR